MGVTSILKDLKDFKVNLGMAHNADQKEKYTTAAKQAVERSRLKINNRIFQNAHLVQVLRPQS